MKRNTPGFRNAPGFTLIELLVAVALLVIIVGMTSTMIDSTMKLIGYSTGRMDSLTEANMALNRLDTDLSRTPWRNDLLPYVNINTGSDQIGFYSSVPAYAGDRTLSVVAYRVLASGSSSPVLQRGTAGCSWETSVVPAPVVFSSGTNAQNASAIAVAVSDWQTLAPDVFRMEVAFVDRATGHFKIQPASASWSDVSGMLVTVAALDLKSRQALGANQGSLMQSLAATLIDFGSVTNPDGTLAPVYPRWQQVALVQTPVTGIPKAIQGRVRIAQRLYQW